MRPIQNSRNTSYQPERCPQPGPVDYRFTVALASSLLSPVAAKAQQGYVSNIDRYEYNRYGGHLDITA
jgi:hypothetical protein